MSSRPLAKFAPFIAIVALVSACTGPSSEGSSPDDPDPATLVEQSRETTAGQTSAHLVLAVDGEIPGLAITSLEGDLTQTPAVAAAGTADMEYLGQQLNEVEFVVFDADLWVALTPGAPLSNFGPAAQVYDVAAVLSPDVGLANVLAEFSDAESDGVEEIEGVTTQRITGSVSADAVNKICPQLAATGPVPGTVWIAEEGDHELMQVRLEPSADSSITMTLSKWGDPVTVDEPAV